MSQTTPVNPYDQVVYDCQAHYATHPDRLGTMATLLGMSPAPVDRCRILELGCGTGGNLLPMAEALPGSELVGVDYSGRQIEMGQQAAAALRLDNLRLIHASVTDLTEELGRFDYILCHGVYSWVPAPVRDAILAVCKRHLRPEGVAFVSYNTQPGWHLRLPVREMMLYHVSEVKDPAERTRQARALLAFVAEHPFVPDGTWAKLLRDEVDLSGPLSDSYLMHEHLEENNTAFYFHEFVAHAGRHGLKYLSEASNHINPTTFAPEVQETLKRIAPDLLSLEQYVDFLRCRTFRRTLLVHDHAKINRTPMPSIMERFSLTATARPQVAAAGEVDVCSRDTVLFKNQDEGTVETSNPIIKASLMTLFDVWPQRLAFDDLWRRSRARLEAGGLSTPDEVREVLAHSMVQLFLSNLVELHVFVPHFVTEPSERPLAPELYRLQARTGAAVANRRHKMTELGPDDRVVLSMLDGRHDRAALVEALVGRVLSGEVELRKDGEPLRDAEAARAVIAANLEGSLERLARMALLIG